MPWHLSAARLPHAAVEATSFDALHTSPCSQSPDPPNVPQLIPVALGMRQYSAKLELFRQLAAQFHPYAPVRWAAGSRMCSPTTAETP
jgi:hypothetical protein